MDMLFILLLALILFGPKRLPEIARQIGKFVAEFKRASNDFKYQLQAEIDKASPAPSTQAAQHSISSSASPSTPTTGVLLPAETPAAPSTAESEHERLMRTARMAYEAQAFTLRPPEPPPVAHTAPTGSDEQSSPAEAVSVPSAGSSATAATLPDTEIKQGS